MKASALLFALALALPGFAAASDKHQVEVALTEAHGAVEAAQRAGAAQHASADMRTAEDDLVRAESAFEHRDWTHATMNAEKAKADANLAEARARQSRAEASTAEVETTVRRLREELRAAGGAS